MKNEELASGPPIGLDIGTSRIVAARSVNGEQPCEGQLNAFIHLPWSKLAEKLLIQESVFHEVRGSEIVVAGNDAEKFAEILHIETRRPMVDGLLNPDEPHGLAVLRMVVTRLIGKATGEGQKVFFSVPAPSACPPDSRGDGSFSYHEKSCRHILTELGYDATPINEGLAVVFSELGASNYTGIGISFGSGLCNACLAVLSVPVISFSTARAGDFIDSRAALAVGEVSTRVRVQKEHTFRLNGFSGDRVQNALTIYYEEAVRNLLEALRDNLSSARRLPKLAAPIPLVVSGGTAMPKGFFELFRKVLAGYELPVRLSEVRVSAEPLNSTARGALVAAMC